MENTVQDRIYQILWDRRLISIPEDILSPTDVVTIFFPTINDRNLASFRREKTYREAIQNTVPTTEEILNQAIESGFWDQNFNSFEAEARSQILDLQEQLKTKKIKSQIKRIENKILELENSISNLNIHKKDLTFFSADYMADEEYILFLVQKLCYDIDDMPLFKNIYDAKKKYPDLIFLLCGEILNEGVLESTELRQIARSVEWRMLWTLNRENLASLFNRPISDLSYNQRLLIYWSRVYDNVFEDPDRPDMDIIEDDEKLDEWLKNKNNQEKTGINKKFTKEHQEQVLVLDGYYSEECTCGVSKIKVKGLGEKPRHQSDCPFGTWINYTVEEKDELAARFYNKNSKNVRHILNAEQDKIEQVGVLQEQHLRGQKSRKLLGMSQNISIKRQ